MRLVKSELQISITLCFVYVCVFVVLVYVSVISFFLTICTPPCGSMRDRCKTYEFVAKESPFVAKENSFVEASE